MFKLFTMAKKMYTVGGYFFVEDTETGQIITDHVNNILVTPKGDGNYLVQSPGHGDYTYNIEDLIDANDEAFTEVELKKFYTTKTGELIHEGDTLELIKANLFYGQTPFDKYGDSLVLSAGANKGTIWEGPTADYTGFIDAAGQLEAISDDPEDAIGKTGANKVTIYQLQDGNRDIVDPIEFDMGGASAVDIGAIDLFRCTRARVTLSGSLKKNKGNISIRLKSDPTKILAYIPAGKSQTQQFVYSVPRNYELHIDSLILTLSRTNGLAGSADVDIFAVDPDTNTIYDLLPLQITTASPFQREGKSIFIYPEKNDLYIDISSISDNSSIVSANATGHLQRKNL